MGGRGTSAAGDLCNLVRRNGQGAAQRYSRKARPYRCIAVRAASDRRDGRCVILPAAGSAQAALRSIGTQTWTLLLHGLVRSRRVQWNVGAPLIMPFEAPNRFGHVAGSRRGALESWQHENMRVARVLGHGPEIC